MREAFLMLQCNILRDVEVDVHISLKECDQHRDRHRTVQPLSIMSMWFSQVYLQCGAESVARG
jgi:hypothetical protein